MIEWLASEKLHWLPCSRVLEKCKFWNLVKKKNPLLEGLQLSSNAELKKLEIRELILIDTQTYIDMLEYNPKYLPHEFYPNDISQWKSIIDCNQQNQ